MEYGPSATRFSRQLLPGGRPRSASGGRVWSPLAIMRKAEVSLGSGYSHLLIAVVALGVAGHCLAQTAWPRLVVDASGAGDPAAQLTQLRDAFGDPYEARHAQVEQALDYGFGPWGITPPATLQQCSAQPMSAPELSQKIAEVEALMLALEYGDATARLATLESRLCAASDRLEATQVARVPFLLGICRFYTGDEMSAQAAFLRAVERYPELSWDADFPPAPQQVFLVALSAALRSPRTTLELRTTDRPAKLWVDGIEVGAEQQTVTLIGTQHLLQVAEEEGATATLLLQTAEAQRIALVGPVRVRAGLMESPETEEGQMAHGLLVVAAHRRGHSEILVLQAPLPELAWRYNDVDRRWTKVSLVLGKQLVQARRLKTTGGILLGVGAALALSGAAIGFTHQSAGLDLLDEMDRDAGMYDILVDEYETHRQGMVAGFAMLAVGGALVGAGVPFLIQGDRVERSTVNDARLAVTASPEGIFVGLTAPF